MEQNQRTSHELLQSTGFYETQLGKFLNRTIPRRPLIVWLELATWLYVGLPVVLWLSSWLRLELAIPMSAALLIAIGMGWRQTREYFVQVPLRDNGIPLWPLLGGLVAAALWGLYSGAGGFTFYNPDWNKHFAVFRDLVEMPWPVTYQIDGHNVPLIYYTAFYLPAAVVGHLAGWWWGCLTLCVWTCLGVCLAATWFAILVARRPFLAVGMFIFANGLDVLGERLIIGGALPAGNGGWGMMPSGDAHLDWWAGWNFLNLPGHYSQLVWAPQHSLATWCVTAMLAVELSARRGLGHSGLLTALISFWSPFAVIGLAPFALVALVREKGRGLFTLPNLVAVPLLGVGILYTISHTTASPHGFLWQIHSPRTEWPRFVLFQLMEWGLFLLFARELRRSSDPWLRWLFWTAAATLAFYPLHKLGMFNDWCMRATIPALLLLWAGVARSLLAPPFDVESRLLLVLCLIGAMGSLHESARSWGPILVPPEVAAIGHVPSLPSGVAEQYLGSADSFFFRNLARPLVPMPITVPPRP